MRRALLLGALGFGGYLGARYALLPRIQRLVGALSLPGPLPDYIAPPRPPADPWAWFALSADNRVQLFSPKIEAGQGIHTLLAQLAAEELEVDLAQIDVHQPDTARGLAPMLNITGGSSSVMLTERGLRTAAATLRESLRAEAARRWDCSPDEVRLGSGYCTSHRDPSRRLAYIDLAADHSKLPLVAPPPLKEPRRWQIAGQALPRIDLPAKVTGATSFGADVRLPGMLYGVVARPPREGATLKAVRGLERARAQPGVVAVVHEAGVVGVVARRRRQAAAALALLDLDWEGGATLSQADIGTRIQARDGAGALIFREGRRPSPQAGDQLVTAEYRSQMCAPLPFESSVTTAEVRADGVTLYAPVQSTHFVRRRVAKALGLRPEQVRVVVTAVGGSFARKHGAVGDPSVEAALLARAAGRPVQVAYSMAEDLRYGLKRPPSHARLQAVLRADGSVASIANQLAATDGSSVFPPLDRLPRLTGIDQSGTIGAQPLYSQIAHRQVRYQHVALPILTSMFRAPGLTSNVFALESFVDEVAAAAGADPLALRLRLLGSDPLNQRLRRVLEAVAQDAGWGGETLIGQGVACYAYGQAVAAMAADVGHEGGKLRVLKLYVAVEAGRLVNPDVSASQVEGAAIMGLSWALGEALELERGLVRNPSLREYRLLRPSMAPPVHVRLLESEPFLSGLNEIAAGLVAPAVANALFRLTGRRLRTLPLALDDERADR
jgi:isoquinoline 1-oxidoreductase subunit beta